MIEDRVPTHVLRERLAELKARAASLNLLLVEGSTPERKLEYAEVIADIAMLKPMVHARWVEENPERNRADDAGLIIAVRDFMDSSKVLRRYIGDVTKLYREWAGGALPATPEECLVELAEAIGEGEDE